MKNYLRYINKYGITVQREIGGSFADQFATAKALSRELCEHVTIVDDDGEDIITVWY
jgi:hypothetical protein